MSGKYTIEYLSQHEVWRDIEGYEGFYQVSSFGRVRSLDRVVECKNGRSFFSKGMVRKLHYDKAFTGYMQVSLFKEKETRYGVHRLVARAFLPNPNNLPMVNHIDENKTNNNMGNLEWCSEQYNTNYGTGVVRRANNITVHNILVYNPITQHIAAYSSPYDAGMKLGISANKVRNGLNNASACGLIFTYEKDGYKKILKEKFERMRTKPFLITLNGQTIFKAKNRQEAADYCGIAVSTLKYHIRNNIPIKDGMMVSYIKFDPMEDLANV